MRTLRGHGDELLALVLALAWLSGLISGDVPSGRPHLAWFAATGLLVTVPLAWRRSAPVTSALVVLGTGTALALTSDRDLPIGFVLVAVLAAYSLGSCTQGRRSEAALAAALVLVAVDNVRHNDSGVAGLVLTPAIFVGAPWALGLVVSRLRRERGALQRLTAQLERQQAEIHRLAVQEERGRIAREMHDVVAHSLSVMVVQAGAAEQVLEPGSRAQLPLQAIRHTGQEALGEMRRLLGVLRSEQDDGALAPQPGLENVALLVDAARATGLDVSVEVRGEPLPVPTSTDVAAFRLVQESLSNVRKHARASRVAVSLQWDPASLVIDVVDDGAAEAAGPAGHGIIGMRERVALLGGSLLCGPGPAGGWRVHAALPLTG